MSVAIQNVIVTLVALGAAIVLVRRVMGWRRDTAAGKPACPSCEAGEPCTPKADAPIGAEKAHPLILVRSKRGE